MKKNFKLVIVFIFILLSGTRIFLYTNRSKDIYSIDYLTSKEGTKSFYSLMNGENTKDSASFDFEKFNGKWSLIEFESKEGNKIIIDDNTKITNGKFCIVVMDSEHNCIIRHKPNKKSNLTFNTPNSGKYVIRIVGKGASGHFDIKVNSSKNININHKDFFD